MRRADRRRGPQRHRSRGEPELRLPSCLRGAAPPGGGGALRPAELRRLRLQPAAAPDLRPPVRPLDVPRARQHPARAGGAPVVADRGDRRAGARPAGHRRPRGGDCAGPALLPGHHRHAGLRADARAAPLRGRPALPLLAPLHRLRRRRRHGRHPGQSHVRPWPRPLARDGGRRPVRHKVGRRAGLGRLAQPRRLRPLHASPQGKKRSLLPEHAGQQRGLPRGTRRRRALRDGRRLRRHAGGDLRAHPRRGVRRGARAPPRPAPGRGGSAGRRRRPRRHRLHRRRNRAAPRRAGDARLGHGALGAEPARHLRRRARHAASRRHPRPRRGRARHRRRAPRRQPRPWRRRGKLRGGACGDGRRRRDRRPRLPCRRRDAPRACRLHRIALPRRRCGRGHGQRALRPARPTARGLHARQGHRRRPAALPAREGRAAGGDPPPRPGCRRGDRAAAFGPRLLQQRPARHRLE